ALGDRVAAAILFLVEADHRPARDEDVAIDDGPPQPRVAPDADARHQDAFLDRAEAVHADVGAEHAAADGAARDDAAGRDQRVERQPRAASLVGEDELRRRRL